MRVLVMSFVLTALAMVPLFAFANTAPVANPGGPYQGVTGATIQFDGSRSSDADGNSLTFTWNFGDSTPLGNGVGPHHTYTAPGNYTVTLVVNDGTASNTQTTTATISIKPPAIPSPTTEAPFISFPLQLDWEDVPGALAYRYELTGYDAWLQEKAKTAKQEMDAWIKEWTDKEIKNWMEDGAKNGFLVTQSQSNAFDSSILKFLEPQRSSLEYRGGCKISKNKDADKDENLDECTDGDLRTFIKEKQKHLWHAKSCEDTQATKCGPWGVEWNFTYLLGPAVLKTPSNGAAHVRLPVGLEWETVPGANSYELITLPCAPWKEADDDCYSIPIHKDAQGMLPTEYNDGDCLFTKASRYTWAIGACLDESSSFCTAGEVSKPSRHFDTALFFPLVPPLQASELRGPLVDPQSPPIDPKNPTMVPRVSKETVLSWSGDNCAYFYQINIYKEDGTSLRKNDSSCLFGQDICTKGPDEIGQETLSLGEERVAQHLWNDGLDDLDKLYSWGVTPCWASVLPSAGPIPDCSNTNETPVEQRWWFRTTGAPPSLVTPGNDTFTKIPIQLSWESVGGAASYFYELQDQARDAQGNFTTPAKQGVVFSSAAEIPYEAGIIEPNSQYGWRVKTCVDEERDKDKKVCGSWSEVRSLTTYPVNRPSTLQNPPPGGETVLPGTVTWAPDLGANHYYYKLDYLARSQDETLEDCPADLVGQQVARGITSANGAYIPSQCLGEYRLAVRSCIETCDESTPESPTASSFAIWSFNASEPPPPAFAGLVPCARDADVRSTPYNEREHCKLKHAGFLLQNILDFVLWKVSLFVLLILAVITGATSYFSLGGPNALARIKTVFRSFFAGFLILMFAWTLVNIVLMLFGFQSKFFGRWWELSF